jgi:hypothetical protein
MNQIYSILFLQESTYDMVRHNTVLEKFIQVIKSDQVIYYRVYDDTDESLHHLCTEEALLHHT